MSVQTDSGSDSKRFASLLEEMRGGSDNAAWQLLETYGPHIRAVVRRYLDGRLRALYDSDDFVQSVWASLFRGGDRLEQVSRPEMFIVALARNKIVDELRKRRYTLKHDIGREVSIQEVAESQLTAPDPRPSEWATAKERWQTMMAAETELNQRIVRLRIAGYTYDEIAGELEISERTARRTIRRILAAQLLDESSDESTE